MASVRPVGKKFKATVVVGDGNQRKSKTLPLKAQANAWAKRLEVEVASQRAGILPAEAPPIRQIIDDYTEQVSKTRPFGRNKADVLKKISSHLGEVRGHRLTTERVVDYICKDRKISGVTAAIDLTYMKGVLKFARVLWKYPTNPSVVDEARELLKYMGMLARSNRRDRRPTQGELDKLRAYLGEHSDSLTVDVFDFILASCFRPPSEVTRLRWSDLNEDERTIVIHDRKDPRRKIGNDQVVPLINGAFEIIMRQPRTDDRIFPVNGKSWSNLFPRACKALSIQDLRLYDLRHEAITRLVESGKYSVPEMMLITGHKDPKQLMTYTQLRARDLVGR